MESTGRTLDNEFAERLWRTITYDEVYLKEYASPLQARSELTDYLRFYNEGRPHQALDYCIPAKVYFRSGRASNGEQKQGGGSMFCPKCGHPLQIKDAPSGKSEWYCPAGEMGLSPTLQQGFEEQYGSHRLPNRPILPFTSTCMAGFRFCPGDGEPLNARLECVKCGKHVRDLIYPLVEFHPHKRIEPA